MAIRQFAPLEIAKVTARYPKLGLIRDGVVEGILSMDAIYDDYRIQDAFEIRITSVNPHSERIPALYEIGGRTEAIAKKYRTADPRDLHRNSDGTACLCVKQEENRRFPEGALLLSFIEELAVPYLYALSYFDQNSVWPWEDYSHGALGLLEYYADNAMEIANDVHQVLTAIRCDPDWKECDKQFRRPSAKRACPCGSRKAFDICHTRAWIGLVRLRAGLNDMGYKLNNLLNLSHDPKRFSG
jgi:hypothetical protein